MAGEAGSGPAAGEAPAAGWWRPAAAAGADAPCGEGGEDGGETDRHGPFLAADCS
jgi:hypothetical protein